VTEEANAEVDAPRPNVVAQESQGKDCRTAEAAPAPEANLLDFHITDGNVGDVALK